MLRISNVAFVELPDPDHQSNCHETSVESQCANDSPLPSQDVKSITHENCDKPQPEYIPYALNKPVQDDKAVYLKARNALLPLYLCKISNAQLDYK